MARQPRKRSVSQQLKRSEINLVSARSAYNANSDSYSRNAREGGYAVKRSKRARNRKIITGILVTLIALLVAGIAAVLVFMAYLNSELGTDSSGNRINMEILEAATVDRAAPEDPFWMLLVGTDDAEDGEVSRSDSIILAHIDPGAKKAALISIPRDTMVTLPGYGTAKINAAYAYGQLELDQGHSGAEYCINAVTALTGVGIAGYAQVDFAGFKDVVDALGGVDVEVPLDIIGDTDAGPVDVYAGQQKLDGEHALVFVRSRQFDIGDYQRQADQRIFLQALAKQVLAADPVAIINTVAKVAEITTTNLDIAEIAAVANSLRGMSEADIYTYSLPGDTDELNGISYVVVDKAETKDLIQQITNGNYPDYSDMMYQGESPEDYKPKQQSTATDNLGNKASNIDTSLFTVTVRNGYGLAGSATAISDMLALAGYKQGDIGNANSFVYKETLIIYREESDLAAAEDIRGRLGYGRVIPSLDRYSYDGNVLVVVGGDFSG
jgi:LCP family protein required for cell wall assembly